MCRAVLYTLQHLDSIMLHTLNLYIFYDSCLPRTVSEMNCGAFHRENLETKMARERNEWHIKKRWQDDEKWSESEREWALPGLITEHIISVDGNWTCVKENTTVQVEEKMERIPDCGAECRLVCWWGTITGRGEGQHECTIRRWRAGCFNSSSFGFVTTDCGGIYSAAVSLLLRLVSTHFTEITCQPVKRKRPIQHWEIWHFIKGAHALMELFSQVNFTYEVQI